MSTSQILQHLYSLDTSSPDFLRHLHCLIRNDEEEDYLSSLQGSELVRLVNFLDTVCPLPSAPRTVRNRFCRLSVSFPAPIKFPDSVYTNCKQSVANARPYHPRTRYPAVSPELVIAPLPMVALLMCGKAPTKAKLSVSRC